MALTPGTRFGPYEIVDSIGAGGMGEIYRAIDTKLGREVAIKTLPSGFAQDPDRLARFEREAKLLAALNHANIAAIYGLDEHEGTQFLAMELIAGATLEDRLKDGPLPVEDALRLALQIAAALEAAHERGVVHRDLKPANVMLTHNGQVKVLDFGLAKAFSGDSNEASPAHSPALSLAMTQAGMILGTAGYMSPEQASGQATDQRADVWAFGVVLYEMLTGLPLFSGESVPHILADVLRTEPSWDRLPKNLHPRVKLLLERCLEKKPRNRWHSIADVRIEIEGVLDDPLGVAAPPAVTAAAAARGRLVWVSAFAVAATSAIALMIPAMQHLREARPPLPPETRVDIVTPATSLPTSFALSPDGSRIVFVATDADGESRLWLRPLATTTAEPLAGTEDAYLPFWSPDGRSIGFFADGELARLDLGSGLPQALASVDIGQGGSWSAAGIIVFSTGPGRALSQVDVTGGRVSAATTLGPEQANHGAPHFLPDGRRFLFRASGAAEQSAGLYLGSLDDDTLTRLAPATGNVVYLPSGWLLWINDGRLTAQRFDAGRGALTGQPLGVADRIGWVSAAAGGLVAYRRAQPGERQLTWLSRTGAVLGTVDAADATVSHPRVAPDGRRVAFARAVAGAGQIWIHDGARGNQLTFDGSSNGWPIWSPDGNRIVFGSARSSGGPNLYQVPANGLGELERVFAGETATMLPTSFSPDGRFVLYFSIEQAGASLGVVPMEDERAPQALPTTALDGVHGVFSPDGRWIAYQSAPSGRQEVFLRPFVPPGAVETPARGQWQVSDAGGVFPAWARDGRELFYLDPEGTMMAVAVDVSSNVPELGIPAALFPTRILGGGVDRAQSRQYDVGPDGRFLINTEIDSVVAPITLIQNWNPEARPSD